MKKIVGLFPIVIILTIVLLFSCPIMPTGTAGSSSFITIKNVGWYIDNVDSNFSSSPSSDNPHCYYDFYIVYDGNITINDIDYVYVRIKDHGYWNLNVKNDPSLLDTVNKVIKGTGWYGPDRNILPLQNLTAEVKLINGVISTFGVTYPDPGSLTNTHEWVYTEDCTSPPANSIQTIKRANIVSSSKETSITITFYTNDSLFYNGWVWFYDSSNNYVGSSSQYFRNDKGNANPIILGLNNNGTNNTITLTNSDIAYYNSGTFNNISKFVLVLTDGAQYGPVKVGRCDCRSFTGYITF